MKYIHKILNNCDEVSRLALQSSETPLPFWKRVEVRIHLYYCRCCSNFVQQSKLMDHSIHHFVGKMEEKPPFRLSGEFKDKLKHQLEGKVEE